MGWAKAMAVAGAVVAAHLRGSHGVAKMTCFSQDLDLGDECANFADCCPGESQCILGEGEDFPTCQVCNLEDGPCQVVDCLGGLTPQEPFDMRGFADQHGKLRLDGVQLVDENGEPVVLVGIDSRWVLEERACFDRGSIENAAVNFGANLVVAKFYAGNGLVLTGAADSVTVLQDVKTIVDICKDLGIYVMIVFQAGQDLNDPRIVDPRNFLDDTQGGTAQVFWDQVANEFKDESHVIYNIAGQFDGSDLTWEDILEYHNTIIGRIRNIDADTIIIAATRTFNQNLDEVSQSPVDLEENVMYSVMFSGTEESVGLVLNRILPAISKPLFVLSWVASSHDGTFGPDLLNTKRIMDLITGKTNQLQGIKLSWSSFAFSDLDGPVNSVFPPGTCSNRRFDELTCAGVFVHNLMLSESRLQNGDEVDGDDKALVTIVGVAIGVLSLALIGGAFVVKKAST